MMRLSATRTSRRWGLFALIVTGWLFGLVGTARAAEAAAQPSLKFSRDWEVALAPIRSMPVQDFGFVRSGYTFCENHLMAIYSKRSYDRANPFDVVMHLMADDHLRHTLPVIKAFHPGLIAIFHSGKISLDQYNDPENQDKLRELVSSNAEKYRRPVGELISHADTLEGLESNFAIVPREHEWLSPAEAAKKTDLDALDRTIIAQWDALMAAIRANDAKAGDASAKALAEAVETAARERGAKLPNLAADVFYHEHQPFAKSAYFYVFAALVYVAAWLIGRPGLSWVGYGLLLLGFVEQVIGVALRWILSGRAPLSNMFESFTFAIGGMVLVALVFEAFNRTRIVGVGSAVLGFIFMVLAHKAPIFDSQIRPLMPALQSSWLTYHVVTIMLSYSAFALSCFVGAMYLAKDLVFRGDRSANPLLRRIPTLNALDVFNYRIIGIGFPLLTLGIIFGAVWAATAWGRPWGFDPKETWSAITWLIYAIYLHVRFLAGWKGRRAAIFSVLGFLAVLFTYLGVNYLLPGLHSYV